MSRRTDYLLHKGDSQMSERFDTLLQVRTPAALVDAVDKTASKELVTRSDYVRRAVLERLRADGVKLQTTRDEVA